MTRLLLGLAVVAAGGTAQAQVYGAPGAGGGVGVAGGVGGNPLAGLTGAFAPNFYNRSQQPLSPYLNLLRGGDPAVNYFYGVRPGLPGYGRTGAGAFAPPQVQSQIRGGFLPQAGVVGGDPVEFPAGGAEVAGFQSVGVPATLSTGLGRFGGGGPTGRPGFFGAGSRPTQTPYQPQRPKRP